MNKPELPKTLFEEIAEAAGKIQAAGSMRSWFTGSIKRTDAAPEFDGKKKEGEEQKVMQPEDFPVDFITFLKNQENAQAGAEQLRQLNQLRLAVAISEAETSRSPLVRNKFYDQYGIEPSDLPYYQKTIEDTESKDTLTQSLYRALSYLKHFNEIKEMIDDEETDLKKIILKAYKEYGAIDDPKKRQALREHIQTVLGIFNDEIEKNTELKVAFGEIAKKIEEIDRQAKTEDEIRAGVEDFKLTFQEHKATEVQKFSERLYEIRQLSGTRLLRLATKKPELMRAIHINPDELYTRIFRRFENNTMVKKMRASGFDIAKGIPTEEKALCEFLYDTPLGKKLMKACRLDFSDVENIIKTSTGNLLIDLWGVTEAADADSLDDFMGFLSKNAPFGKHITMILQAKSNHERLKAATTIPSTIQSTFKEPEEYRGKDKEKVVMEAAEDLMNENPNYQQVQKFFDRLCHAYLGQYNNLGKVLKTETKTVNKSDNDATAKVEEYKDKILAPAVAEVRTLGTSYEVKSKISLDGVIAYCQNILNGEDEDWDKRGSQGFMPDYIGLMPVPDKKAINFARFGKGNKFDFSTLLKEYAKGVNNFALIDIKAELKKDIFDPLMVEMGMATGAEEVYNPQNKNYATPTDFLAAQKLFHSGLRYLQNVDDSMIVIEDKKEEDKKEEKKDDKKSVLTDLQRKRVENIVDAMQATISGETKDSTSSDEKKSVLRRKK